MNKCSYCGYSGPPLDFIAAPNVCNQCFSDQNGAPSDVTGLIFHVIDGGNKSPKVSTGYSELKKCIDNMPTDLHYLQVMSYTMSQEAMVGHLVGNIIKYSIEIGKGNNKNQCIDELRRNIRALDSLAHFEPIDPKELDE